MTEEQVLLNMQEAEFLDGDGDITNEGRSWFLDVVDGRISLLEVQVPWFQHILSIRAEGRFYDNRTTAFVFEFARVQAAFGDMLDELGE